MAGTEDAAMVVKLIVVSGKSAGRAIAVKRAKFLIGRAEECDIRPLSEEVSRRHCAILVGPDAVWVEDLGSRNGTFVNGARIQAKTQVTDGDALRVGSLELRFSCVRQGVPGGSDDDVSKWLLTEPDAADTTNSGHVRAPVEPSTPADAGERTSDTVAGAAEGDTVTGIRRLDVEPAAAVAAAGDSGTVKTGADSKAGRPAPGGLPPAKPKSDSSKDAAAQALKKFFENR